MRVLLLQPEDMLHSGPWSRQTWDLIVNLGRPPLSNLDKAQNRRRVLDLDTYSQGLSDARIVREFLRAGRGQLICQQGIDWWDLASITIIRQALTVLQLQRLAHEIPDAPEMWSTRPDWTTCVLADLLHTSAMTFRSSGWARARSDASHYLQVLRNFSPAQIQQIFFDKYDAAYRWRSKFTGKRSAGSEQVVLVPSAYSNVSRVAALYAAMLPNLRFWFVATRHSAHQFLAPENVGVCDLAAYARAQPENAELASLMASWTKLKSDLQA